MSIRHRSMRPNDVRECVEIIAANPLVSARYGSSIADLRPAWLRVLAAQAFCGTTTIEEVEGSQVRMVGIGGTVLVSDDFVRELKTPPFFWIGPELVRRMGRGDSPLLSEKQAREANSRGGLNLAVWHASMRLEDMKSVEAWNVMMAAFMKHHRGYLVKELVTHAECVGQAQGMRLSGSHLWNGTDGRYSESWARILISSFAPLISLALRAIWPSPGLFRGLALFSSISLPNAVSGQVNSGSCWPRWRGEPMKS